MARVGKANFIAAMFYGYRILAGLTESVIGDEKLLGQIRDLAPDLIVGDAVGAYGHWLGGKLGVPSVEFDVGTSSGMLHSGLWGGQLNPAYIPGPGEALRRGCGGVRRRAGPRAVCMPRPQSLRAWPPNSGRAEDCFNSDGVSCRG
jgi:hypothetical protein